MVQKSRLTLNRFMTSHNRRGASETSIATAAAAHDDSASSSRRGSEEDYTRARDQNCKTFLLITINFALSYSYILMMDKWLCSQESESHECKET